MENGNGRTKKMRLGKSNARDRARRIPQMPVDKKIRLEKRKVTLANESCERRAARLECMRQSLEAEIPEQRVARLEQMSTLQQSSVWKSRRLLSVSCEAK